jgi:hypothetical protein
MTRRYHLDLSCPRCGGELVHIADGQIRPWWVNVAVECRSCRNGKNRFVLAVRLFAAEENPL